MSYLKTLLISLLTTVSIIATFNWFIDPYGMFWSPQIPHINVDKTEAANKVRITKILNAKNHYPTVLIIGNSRVEMGLNPNSLIFEGKSVFNLGIPGLGFSKQSANAISMINQSSSINTVFISLDYLDFLTNINNFNLSTDDLSDELKASIEHNDSNKTYDITSILFSLDATIDSLKTLAKQNTSESSITSLGFNTATSYLPIIQYEGKSKLFEQKLNELKTRLDISPQKRAVSTNANPNFFYLKELLTTAKEKNITVHTFINPYHYSYLQLLNDLGYWEDFLAWKVELSNFLQLPNNKSEYITLTDFSGINTYTLENVDLENDHKQMQWFWEPAHYKSQLGDLMLADMFSSNTKKLGRNLLTAQDEILIDDKIQLLKSNPNWEKLKKELLISH